MTYKIVCTDGVSIPESNTRTECQTDCCDLGKNDCLDASDLSLPVLPETEQARKRKPLSFFFSSFSLLLMVFLVSLDATILAVAILAITSKLSGTTLTAVWANISFILAVVAIQPIYTSVSDIVGRRLPFYAAFTLFTIGSIVFSVSQSMSVIFLGRVLQGLGGGGLDVLSEIIVADITTLQECPLYIGLLSLPMAAGSILGALFSEYVDWRWIGWINLPVIAVALTLAIFFMRLKPLGQSLRTKIASWRTIVPLIIGALILLIFALYEAQPAEPVFPYRISRSQTAQLTLIGSFIHGLVLYNLLTYLLLFFQAVYLETPLLQVIAGVGIGTIFTVPPIPMQASAPTAEDQSLAAGILVSFRQFGALIGLAVWATTFSNVFSRSIASVGALPESVALLSNAKETVGYIPPLRTVEIPLALKVAICEVYKEALRTIWYIVAGFGGGGGVDY
ncbi:major facilitator superfamily domain-containing protein [Aspergillus alliaceus]|uniref:major facilitator superfamily domain-containing protein n=1 Tax=Petromyces alliaceus TaxID=209559 RepID=UPI0012A5EE0B|nr:major facilitator superfamily domain-containing protein [Aspergillus alliaceus]KAB8237237.1 major facilitator superfamily domain-containing protein [Aspergillus alliaceus]